MKGIILNTIGVALAIIITSSAIAQTNYNYPRFEEVVNTYFTSYATENIVSMQRPRFVKKPEGWFVQQVNRTPPEKVGREELFWSRKKGKYLSIKHPARKESAVNEDLKAEYLTPYLIRYNAIHPYCGYIGWDDDVIRDFGSAPTLSDSLLYGLGRAYSNKATDLLSDRAFFANNAATYKMKAGKNALNKEQLNNYLHYHRLAVKTYNRLQQQNHDFSTIVGKINIKRSNEFLTAYLDLSMVQNEAAARKVLEEGLYNEFYINLGKNYLESCAPNAILFTNGDNDTFPLLYVQAMLGFRTDVLVVNTSMLSLPRYVNHLRDKVLDAAPLPISFTKEQYQQGTRGYALLMPEKATSSDTPTLQSMMAFLAMDSSYIINNEQKLYYIPTSEFTLNTDGAPLHWTIKSRYLTRGQFLMLDIIAQCAWERPVYFATSSADNMLLGLNNYLQQEGMAYRLVTSPQKKSYASAYVGAVNTDIMYTNLMEKFQWTGAIDTRTRLQAVQQAPIVNYRYTLAELATALIEANDEERAKAVLKKCLETFPASIKYSQEMYWIAEAFYRVNDMREANNIAERMLLNNGTKVYQLIEEHPRQLPDEVMNIMRLLMQLQQLTEKYQQTDLAKRFEQQLEQMSAAIQKAYE